MNHCFCSISSANENNGTNSLVHHFETFAGIQHKTRVKNCGSWIRQNMEKMTKDDCMNGIIPRRQAFHINQTLSNNRENRWSRVRVLALKSRVKHDQTWLPHRWVTINSYGLLHTHPETSPRVKFCADSKQALWMRLKTEVHHVYMCKKIIHTG